MRVRNVAAGAAAIAVMATMAVPAVAATTVSGLRANADPRPLGIDDPTPRLSWRLDASDRAVPQSKYRVVVASTAAKAAAGEGDVWDSGEVASDATAVDYSGPALASRTRYFWSVRSWTGAAASAWAAASWFETAYLSASDWKGSWISGPARTPALLTNAQALADDACCLKGDTTLHSGAAAGATVLRVASTSGFAAGQSVTVADEAAELAAVGTAASSTTAVAPLAAGATNVKVASVNQLAEGAPLTIGGQTVTITSVGTAAGNAQTLFAPAAAGATNIKVSSTNGFTVGQSALVGDEIRTVTAVGTQGRATTLAAAAAAGATVLKLAGVQGQSVGDTLLIGDETRTLTAVGTAGTDGTGVTLSAPLGSAYASGAAVRVLGTGITLSAPLSNAHAQGTTTRGLGTGVDFTPALTDAQAAGTALGSPGTGLTLRAPLARAHAAGAPVLGPDPRDFCRPVNGSPVSGNCKEVRPAPYLRKSFAIAPVSEHGAVVSARVYASGLSYNEMTLNGTQTAERSFLNPGFTSYDKTIQYTTDDVTGLIRQNASTPAENVVASQLGSGRYDSEATSGNHGWERAEWRANPTLRADLHIRYADGTEQLVKSDETWKVSDAGPIRYDNFDLGETYDARFELPNWDAVGFDVSNWAAARTVSGPAGRLVAQREDRTRKVADWPAGTRSEPRPGIHLWNTGQQRAGWATVKVSGAPAGYPIQIRYAEKLGADGLVSISGYAPAGQIQTDYYVSKGTAAQTFAPRFTYKGFQYIQITAAGGTALPAKVQVDVESVQEVRTEMAETGVFASSSPLINQIERMTRAAIKENYILGFITDTPTYEKDGWTGDAQLTIPTAALMFDTARQNMKTTQDIVDDQYADGQVGLLTPANQYYGYSGPPSGTTFKPANGGSTPIWDALLFVSPWEAYQRYADTATLAHGYPAMKKYLTDWIPRWFAADADGFDYTLTSGLGDWSNVTGNDPSAPIGSSTRVNVSPFTPGSSTAYVAYMAKITADSARALGKPEEAAPYDALYNNVKADFNAKWWDAAAGYYREPANTFMVQGFQVLALAFDLVPAAQRRGLQEKLVEDILVTRQGHQMTGIASSRWIYPVLTEAAHEGVPNAAKAAYTIAQQTTYPSYGYWASLGWTSLGENWESGTRTRNHHMFGSISQWFYEHVAGIQLREPGYRRIAIRPLITPDGLDSASASYESPKGLIRSSWSRSARGVRMDVTVPANTTARVSVPGNDPAKVGEVGSGVALIAGNAPGVKLVGVEQDAVVYEVSSGQYAFRVGPGEFAATTVDAPVGGTVPATLSLSLGAPATFGAFTPGVAREYTASTTATVTSTAGDAALSVSDPGHLANGPFTLPQPLRVAFSKSAWSGPVSNDGVTIDFKQSIGSGDALRTGTYSKTLTFTLSTTNP